MWYQSIFALALALPTSLAMQLLSSTSTTQTLICSTEYASTSLLGAVPTTTLNQTIEKEPQLLHTTVIPTEFVTPKPFSTRITLLETLTVNVTTTPSNGTWTTNSTVFDVSTFWYHSTVTHTTTEFITGTTRKTSWIPAPTGFVPARNSTSGLANQKRDVLQARAGKPKLQAKAPLAKNHPVAVNCTNLIKVYTTETMIFTDRKAKIITLDPETLYRTATVTTNLTSTILSIPTGTASIITKTASALFRRGWWNFLGGTSASAHLPTVTDLPDGLSSILFPATTPAAIDPSAAAAALSYFSAHPSAALAAFSHLSLNVSLNISTPLPPPTPGLNGIVTINATTTITPLTVTSTWTGVVTATSTSTMHATTTTTSYAACATANQLFDTSVGQRINAFRTDIQGNQSIRAIGGVMDAYECCVSCITRDGCAWSLFEVEGRDKGNCLLYDVVDVLSEPLNAAGDVVGGGGGRCQSQDGQMGVYAFAPDEGEVAYVASNGFCGSVGQMDLVFKVE